MATIEELEARVAYLELLVGEKFSRTPPTPADLNPANEIPGSGRYPSILADYQLRLTGLPPIEEHLSALDLDVVSINELLIHQDARLDALEAMPSPAPGGSAGPFTFADGVWWIKSTAGAGIYFESDTDFTTGQRPAPPHDKYRQVFCCSLSGDGGGGMHQNIVYPEDGTPAYIPDPTRFAMSYRMDRQGMMSINIHKAGAEFAPGKFTPVAVHKGQLAVIIPELNGNVTLRLPEGGDLLVEKGNGRNDRVDGHKQAISRQPVLLGADVGSPAVGGLPGGGGT